MGCGICNSPLCPLRLKKEDLTGASKFCGQILEFTGVVPSALNGIDDLFSNFSPHKGTKYTKESQLPSIPLCPSCLCAKHNLYHLRHGVVVGRLLPNKSTSKQWSIEGICTIGASVCPHQKIMPLKKVSRPILPK